MKSIVISSSSSWSLWTFRSELIEKIAQKYKIIFFSKEKKYLSKIKIKNKNFFQHNIKYYFKNIFFLKKNKIDVFIEYDIKNLFFHLISKVISNYKLTVICAGLGSYYNRKGYFNFFEILILKFLFKAVDKTIFINKYDKKIFLDHKISKNNFIIPSEGYKFKINKYAKAKKKVSYKFVLAARPIEEKGIFEYLSISKKFPQHFFYFYLIGNNKKKIFYNSKKINLNKHKIPKNFIIMSQVNNFQKVLNNYDCLISCSYGEGFGATIADATSVGLPVISTNVNGPKYIFRKKSLIWIAPKSVKSLEKKINFFLKLSSLKKIKLISNAKKDLKKIDSKKINKKIIDIIFTK